MMRNQEPVSNEREWVNPSLSGPAALAGILDCRIAGSHIRIEALPPAVRVLMADLFRPFVMELDAREIAEPVARFRAIRRGRGDWIVRRSDPGERFAGEEDRGTLEGAGRIGNLMAVLEWRSVDAALSATNQYAVIHAAALRRGPDTVVLLGKSGVGKTTLALGLMGRGWEPCTDDATLIDAHTLEVRAFPRCFHVDAATLVALPTRPPLERAGRLSGYLRPVRWADGGSQPSAIVIVERNPQLLTTMHPLSQAEAAGALLEAMIRNQLPASDRARIAVRLASEAQRCCALNNMSLAHALDLIEATLGV